MKRILSVLICITILLGTAAGCAAKREEQAETRIFTDSIGREVTVPVKIGSIAPSGSYAQIMLLTLCPELLTGLSGELTDVQKPYFDEKYWDLPVFGRLYGSTGTINLEALVSAAPDVIIDMGEVKPGIGDDLDTVQEQTGIPVVFIEATLGSMADAYTSLGELLGVSDAAEERAEYIREVLDFAADVRGKIPEEERPNVLFSQGQNGNEVNGRGVVHAEILDVVGVINVADMNSTISSGGDEVSLEQILLWNPEIVILAPDSNYATISSDPAWAQVAAVKNGEVYEVPIGPYNWLNRPPSVQRVLGILWLGNLIYPEHYDFDIVEKTQEFYKLFFAYEITETEVAELLKNSTFN